MNTELCSIRVETLGCRLNQVESESFAALCTDAGFSLYIGASVTFLLSPAPQHISEKDGFTPHTDPAAAVVLCLVNTCTVTGKAEQKARRLLRLLVKEHPHAVMLVTGCYAQLNGEELEAIHPHIIAFPGRQKDLLTTVPSFFAGLVRSSPYPDTAFLLSALRTYLINIRNKDAACQNGQTENERQTPVQPAELFALSSSRFLFHSRAMLKIQDGCNNSCAYCRIRLARGSAQSLPADEVIHRLKQIEEAGIPEVTLSGVNLSQYRSGSDDFAGLLARILKHIRIRIRISSLYPDRIDAALIPLLGHPQICPHFHLSVQSGSSRILQAMHRSYTRETVYTAVAELRRIKDNPFIGVDIITGFPGETETDFEDTYRMCRELHFAGIHAFPFSARPGTEAAKMQPKVPERIAGKRVKMLNMLAEEQAAAYLQAWDGELVYGVTEEPQNNRCTVITENYLSLPLTAAAEEKSTALSGGTYVRIRVRGNEAEPVEICSPRVCR